MSSLVIPDSIIAMFGNVRVDTSRPEKYTLRVTGIDSKYKNPPPEA